MYVRDGSNWVRLAPNGTHLRLFKDQFQYLRHSGPIWPAPVEVERLSVLLISLKFSKVTLR